MSEKNHCKNCGSELKSFYKHCPECGQKVHDNLTLGVLFSNTISNYFSVDARFFRSFIPLMFRPGYLARKFVEGRRLMYLHPAQYYLFVSVVFFFIFSFNVREYNAEANKFMKKGFEMEKGEKSLDLNLIDSAGVANIAQELKNNQTVTGINEEEIEILDSIIKEGVNVKSNNNFNFWYDSKKLDSLIASGASEKEQLAFMGMKEDDGYLRRTFFKQWLKFNKQEGGDIVQVIVDTIPIALFFLLPIFALILKLFYWRKGRFSHHLVFSFYYFCFLFIILGTLIGVNHFIWDIPGWLESIILLYAFLYLWWSQRHFYGQGYFVTLLKSGIITFIYMIFNLTVTLGLLVLAGFLFY